MKFADKKKKDDYKIVQKFVEYEDILKWKCNQPALTWIFLKIYIK